MPLQFEVTNPEGETKPVSVESLADILQSKFGEQVLGISPDGMTLQVMDTDGPIDVPVMEAFHSIGFQASNPTPQKPDYSQVSPSARAAITAIGGEDNKLAYLKMLEQKRGNLNPQIMGSGRDFFVFDPQTNQYRALTNNPEWDSSDLAEFGVEAPGAIGSIIGGGLGAAGGAAAGGVPAIPGLMAGAAAGSAIGNSVTKIATSILDPDAGKVMGNSLGRQAAGVAGSAAMDAVGAGVGAKIPGLASTAAKYGGDVVASAGRMMGHGAKMIDKPLGRDIVGSMVTGPTMATAELGLRAPAEIMKAANRFPGWLGQKMAQAPEWLESKGLMSDLGPEAQEATKRWFGKQASQLQNYTKRLNVKTDFPSNARGEMMRDAEKFANFAGGKPKQSPVTLEDELANLGEYMGAGKKGRQIQHVAEEGGYSPSEARMFARTEESNPAWAAVGAKAGRALETANSLGKGIGAANQAVGGGVIKGIRGAGVLTTAAGDAARYAGTAMSPLENRFLSRYGSEEYLKKKRPWQMSPNTATINPVQYASEE